MAGACAMHPEDAATGRGPGAGVLGRAPRRRFLVPKRGRRMARIIAALKRAAMRWQV